MGNVDMLLRIKELIIALSISRKEFAKKIGINQSNLSKILLGERPCGGAIQNKITDNLNVSRKWLLTGEGEMFNTDSIEFKENSNNSDDSMILRIKEIMATEKYRSVSAFAQRVGIAQTTLNDIMSKGNEPKLSTITKIINAFPLVSRDWLLTGKGNMMKGESESAEGETPDMDQSRKTEITTRWRNYISAYLILPMGLPFSLLIYCRIVSALIFPIMRVNNPSVSFA